MNYVIYRISDTGYSKVKPSYIQNESCLRNAISMFPNFIFYVIADNVCDATYQMILKYVKEEHVRRVSVGNGAGTFRMAVEWALTLPSESIVYFLENDYLHRPGAESILLEGFTIPNVGFLTLYDHPDKYSSSFSPNPYVEKGGEVSRVVLTKSIHWKNTNSTTMTFATRVGTLRVMHPIMQRYIQGSHPHDFQMCLELQKAGFLLYSPLPGYATHGETAHLCPLVDWEQIANI